MSNPSKFGVPLSLLVLGTMLFAGTEDNTPATVGSHRPRIFAADERLSATMPDGPVRLAQPVQIPLYLTDASVDSITISQGNKVRTFENRSSGVAIGGGDAKVVQDNGSTKIIEITPLQVGVLNIDIVVFFADGGMGHKRYQMNVVPSSRGLKQFSLNGGFDALAIVLEDKDEDRQKWLSPEVYYNRLDYPIHLTNSELIKFTVQQSDGYPVIRLDSNGMLHALRPGKAKIIADFDGVQDSVVVTVYTKENAPSGYRRVPKNPKP